MKEKNIRINNFLSVSFDDFNTEKFMDTGTFQQKFTVKIDCFDIEEEYYVDIYDMKSYCNHVADTLERRDVFVEPGNSYLFYECREKFNTNNFIDFLSSELDAIARSYLEGDDISRQDVSNFLLQMESIGNLQSGDPYGLYLEYTNHIGSEDVNVELLNIYRKDRSNRLEKIDELKKVETLKSVLLVGYKISTQYFDIEPIAISRIYSNLETFKNSKDLFFARENKCIVKFSKFSLMDEFDEEIIANDRHWINWVVEATNRNTIIDRFKIHYDAVESFKLSIGARRLLDELKNLYLQNPEQKLFTREDVLNKIDINKHTLKRYFNKFRRLGYLHVVGIGKNNSHVYRLTVKESGVPLQKLDNQ